METTLDVRGLPEDRIEYLKHLITLWKDQETKAPSLTVPTTVKRNVHPSEFLVVKSHVIGDEVTRAMAYDE